MTCGDRPDPLALIAKMSAGERQLSELTFLAPITVGGGVRVRVNGVVYELKVKNPILEGGWALLRCTAPGVAEIAGEPSLPQIAEFMKLLPRVRMVLLHEFGGTWWGVQASPGDNNLHVRGAIPLNNVRVAAAFDTVSVRFDGARFWYEAPDRRRDPSVARAIRTALAQDLAPELVRVKGMTPHELIAYRLLFIAKHPEMIENKQRAGMVSQRNSGSVTEKIRAALEHSGAFLDAFWSANDQHTTVRFVLDGETRTVTVASQDLTVVSAGICLSGDDADFDLASLVGVLRESRSNWINGD